jgi:hypothetical protein
VKIGFRIFISCTILFLCLKTASINAQIFQDTESLNLIKTSIDSIYDGKFKFAQKTYIRINELYPQCPVVVLFKGIITYWKYYPLLSVSPERIPFIEDMNRCIDLCEKNKNPSYTVEYLLANLCARGLLLTYYSDNDLRNEVFPLVRTTYRYVRSSFDYTSVYSDFFFFTGLYNYYREVYPREHPVYRPLAFLFPRGSREKGLNELQAAARSSIFFKAEAYSLLSYIYISYEDDYRQAYDFSKYLYDLYPNNPEYLGDYIKNLLLLKNYDEAEREVNASSTIQDNSYFRAQVSVFNGIIEEKKYHDYNSASQFYNEGIREMSHFGVYGNEYTAYACFGLSRISGYNGDRDRKNYYHKQALRLADLKKIDFD